MTKDGRRHFQLASLYSFFFYRYRTKQRTSMKFITKIMFILLFFILIRYFINVKSISRSVKAEKEQNLIIGILSAPQNFEQRLSIRKTWLKLTSYVPAKPYFLIGRENCGVHPLDRLNPYSCVENDVHLPINPKTTFSTILKQNNFEILPEPVIGFGFYVIFDIIITKLGITSKLLRKVTSTIRVKLLSSFDKSVLTSVMFHPDENTTDSELVFKKIKPMQLPKQYEAIVVLESINGNDVIEDCFDWTWDTRPGVINITQIINKGEKKPHPFKFNTCSHVYMDYNIPDIDRLKKFLSFKETREREQKQFNKKLAVQLKNESIKYNDLLLLDVTDIYENLSEKMIQFYLRISKENNFNYILKTDDDSFIDLLRVHKQLEQLKNNSTGVKMWWWSYFKEFWAVPNSGKWKDDKYRSISYPPFPCGGGYVINKEIVDYIAKNFNFLKRFKGEDISLGIWLSGLYVRRPEKFSKEYSIQEFLRIKFREMNHLKFLVLGQCQNFKTAADGCAWTCDNKRKNNKPLCNKVQLSIGGMYETWEDFKISGYL